MSEPSQPPIHSPHDRFFKENFGRLEVARAFFAHYLPPGLGRNTDWSSLQPHPAHFVDERLTLQSSDLLFSVRVGKAEVLLYLLFEHQSTVDALLRFRLLQYMVRIWEWWLREDRPTDGREVQLPPILPLVLHQGETGWTVSVEFLDLIGLPAEAGEELARYQPKFEHALVDLHELPLEELRDNLVLYLLLTLMRAVREGDSVRWLEQMGPRLAQLLHRPDRAELFRTLLVYLTRADTRMTPSTFREVAARLAPQEVRGDVMTLAEALIEEGRQEGWQKGQQEGRQEGLERGTVIGRIQLCQGLLGLEATTVEELSRWETSRLGAELTALETQLRDRLRKGQ
jgi:predicted transposase YdaD